MVFSGSWSNCKTVFLRPCRTVNCISWIHKPSQKPWSNIWLKIWSNSGQNLVKIWLKIRARRPCIKNLTVRDVLTTVIRLYKCTYVAYTCGYALYVDVHIYTCIQLHIHIHIAKLVWLPRPWSPRTSPTTPTDSDVLKNANAHREQADKPTGTQTGCKTSHLPMGAVRKMGKPGPSRPSK